MSDKTDRIFALEDQLMKLCFVSYRLMLGAGSEVEVSDVCRESIDLLKASNSSELRKRLQQHEKIDCNN